MSVTKSKYTEQKLKKNRPQFKVKRINMKFSEIFRYFAMTHFSKGRLMLAYWFANL